MEEKKTQKQSPSSSRHGQIRVRERNVVSIKAKKNHPQFVYNRAYVGIQAGKCQEYIIDGNTSLLTRDERFKEFMDRPYAVIPQGNYKEEKGTCSSCIKNRFINPCRIFESHSCGIAGSRKNSSLYNYPLGSIHAH